MASRLVASARIRIRLGPLFVLGTGLVLGTGVRLDFRRARRNGVGMALHSPLEGADRTLALELDLRDEPRPLGGERTPGPGRAGKTFPRRRKRRVGDRYRSRIQGRPRGPGPHGDSAHGQHRRADSGGDPLPNGGGDTHRGRWAGGRPVALHGPTASRHADSSRAPRRHRCEPRAGAAGRAVGTEGPGPVGRAGTSRNSLVRTIGGAREPPGPCPVGPGGASGARAFHAIRAGTFSPPGARSVVPSGARSTGSFGTSPICPFGASPICPLGTSPICPFGAGTVRPVRTSTVFPFGSRAIRPLGTSTVRRSRASPIGAFRSRPVQSGDTGRSGAAVLRRMSIAPGFGPGPATLT